MSGWSLPDYGTGSEHLACKDWWIFASPRTQEVPVSQGASFNRRIAAAVA